MAASNSRFFARTGVPFAPEAMYEFKIDADGDGFGAGPDLLRVAADAIHA